MYDVNEGRFAVDGHGHPRRDDSEPPQNIGYVSQETFMFYGTVKENIAYGTFDASGRGRSSRPRRPRKPTSSS